jgi:hypothetical protein
MISVLATPVCQKLGLDSSPDVAKILVIAKEAFTPDTIVTANLIAI